jgi:hypothetical protein
MNAGALSSESAVEAFVVHLSTLTELESWGQGSNLSRGQKA